MTDSIVNDNQNKDAWLRIESNPLQSLKFFVRAFFQSFTHSLYDLIATVGHLLP